ncbi:sulfate adenylyltransferase subunit CysD [Luteimonas terrae]|uniref:Sulfate adenylyltransferase subunit 2 n=1 Tax=Luteimonas terrae TaxID=1530191 RepID=A0A4R5U6X1_9GAMM|nr:sulfate adenylyltransferase subunit CysD [Luteimonas terrae]TDK29995.1 sulfate adenylyltransferase subunit CysD [Luteimonas terrae]
MENAVQSSFVPAIGLSSSSVSADLDRLEAEGIHILRETAAECARPVLLYSIGKDSSVLLHLLLKAFAPAKPPIPLLHVDTLWKFREMIEFRDRRATETGVNLKVHVNADGAREGVDPQIHGAARHTEIMKTVALKQALEAGRYDAAIGGARRDEEKSRAKERIFSFRDGRHRWDPRQQRPELWNLYNPRVSAGESVRVFPLSNWTELDVWRYIKRESIPVVPLYFAKPRPVVRRNGVYLMVDDERFRLLPGEEVETRSVRFRTLGCYPLTGAVESEAADLDAIISEMASGRQSERAGRLIDHAEGDSMEKKKREGYF